MNVTVGKRWEAFVETVVQNGRFTSASEVVQEGLRLVEEREAGLNSLRSILQASIEAGGDASDEEIDAALEAASAKLAGEGY